MAWFAFFGLWNWLREVSSGEICHAHAYTQFHTSSHSLFVRLEWSVRGYGGQGARGDRRLGVAPGFISLDVEGPC